jgi:hypothetical protein
VKDICGTERMIKRKMIRGFNDKIFYIEKEGGSIVVK